MSINNKLKFYVPIEFEKGKKGTEYEGKILVEGVASDQAEDADGQFLDPEGFDFTPLVNGGLINWNHNLKTDPEAALGVITHGEIRRTLNGSEFFIKGWLWEDHPQVQKALKLQERLKSIGRRLGWSIEGKSLLKDSLNERKVLKARIVGVALTPYPKNGNTFVDIVKGSYTDAFQEDEDIEDEDDTEEKAMTAEAAVGVTSYESLEGKPKHLELTKSQVYEEIFSRYPQNDLNDYKSIYNFIEKHAQVHSPDMKKTFLTKEQIDSAFSDLEKGITTDLSQTTETTDTLEKGDGKTDDDSPQGPPVDEDDDEDDEIEKGGGAGSRGGRIRGYTQSGKPIYANYDHPAHSEYTAQDHHDASNWHDTRVAHYDSKIGTGRMARHSVANQKANTHYYEGQKHFESASKLTKGESNEEVGKAFDLAKGSFYTGMKQDIMSEALIRGGISFGLAVAVASKVTAEMNAKSEGHYQVLKKSEEELFDLVKSQEDTITQLQETVVDLLEWKKSFVESGSNTLVKGIMMRQAEAMNDLVKSFEDELHEVNTKMSEMDQKFQQVLDTPVAPKSIVGNPIGYHQPNFQQPYQTNTLEKGQDFGDNQLSLTYHKEEITDRLLKGCQMLRDSGKANPDFERASKEFMISGKMSREVDMFFKSQEIEILS